MRTFGITVGCWLLLVFGTSTAGCSSDDTGSPAVARDQLAAEVTQAVCDNYAACCAPGAPFDAAGCRELTGERSNYAVRASMPTLAYDEKLGGECVAALKAAATACADTVGLAACRGIFTGTVPPGGSCTDSIECLRGDAPAATCKDGTCFQATTAAAGESCNCVLAPNGEPGCFCTAGSNVVVCDAGLICADADDAGRRVCVGPGAVGADCSRGQPCASDAYCDGNYPAAKCVAKLPLSAPCGDPDGTVNSDHQCVDGAYCSDLPGVAGSCVPKKQAGEPCEDQRECLDACGPESVCATPESFFVPIYCGG